jgi:apolipoprotein D and lipocalin family protein
MLKGLALGGLWLGILPGLAGGQSVKPVAQLDAGKFFGTWFEIARLPNRAEKKCAGDAFTMFAPAYKTGRFQIVDSCKRPDGTHEVRNLDGRRADKNGDGKLKVVTLWPLTAKYWVVGVGPDYDWTLLATPNRKKLWVLSKTATLAPDQLSAAEAMASAQGFNTGKLVAVSQTP